MHAFTFLRVSDAQSAIAAHGTDPRRGLHRRRNRPLVGLHEATGATLPGRLLDINTLPALAAIEPRSNGGLHIGALARMSDVAAHPAVRRRFPVVAESLLFAASGQLRNMASIGGNILQRTRCAYFRDGDGLPCNKRAPGSGCSALHGLNRSHAIFGWSESCVATHPSDLAVALTALDAIVHVRTLHGDRVIAFSEFHRLPGDVSREG